MAAGTRNNPIETFNFASVADKPFTMDWTEWLVGAVLTAATVSLSNSTLVSVHDIDFTVNGSTTVRVWVRGLDAGIGEVFVTVRVTANDGRVDARAWMFNVNSPGS